MPSRTHDLLARVVPVVRRSRDLDDEPTERARVERWHQGLDGGFPHRLAPGFHRRFTLVTEELAGFPVHVMTPRHTAPTRTVLHVPGGAFMAPLDPFHVRFLARLSRDLGARVVVPSHPLAPEHTWRDSFGPLTDLVARWADPATGGRLTLSGDSAGGGYALALAQAVRDRGGPQPAELVLLSPWADLSTSTPETADYDAVDPWLFLGKVHAYARWWAGPEDDLARTELSPALGDLTGLPRALMLCGTRDLLLPGCRLLARRGAEAGWDLTYVEQPDLLHVYPLLPLVPEARVARHQVLGFLR
jgi:monoterpene epsilon-lactone hydrolase